MFSREIPSLLAYFVVPRYLGYLRSWLHTTRDFWHFPVALALALTLRST